MIKHFQHRTTALAAALLLAGCSSLAPTYERPDAPIATDYPAWRGASAQEAQIPALPGDAGPREKAITGLTWQSYFTDPRLQQLITLALDGNRDLRLATLALAQTRAQYQIQSAQQLPSIGLGAGASHSTGDSGKTSYTVGVTMAAWELDFFGRIASLKDQALSQYLASVEGRSSAQLSLIAAVANAWLALQADEELLGLTQRTLATREKSMALIRLRQEVGVASELDMRQAQSLTEAARVTLAQHQRQRALDENALTLLLGQAIPADILQTLPGSALNKAAVMAPLAAGLPSDLLAQRPDIRQAEWQLQAANANIGAARAAFYPSITLTAQAGTASSELSGLFKSGSWAFAPSISALLPIFNAGRNQAALELSEAGRDIAVAQYEKAIQTAFREVSDALISQQALNEQRQAQMAQVAVEAQRLHLSTLRYENGVASHLDLLDAQRSMFALEQAAVQTRLVELQNQVLLFKALGGGTQAAPAQAPL